MSRKIARITQDKKLLLANAVVESNAKTSLNSDGRLDVDEIMEYPTELEGGRNLAPITDYSHDNQYQTVTKTDETFNGQPVYRAIKKTTLTPPTSIGSITIRKGETFTASIWIKHEQQPTMETARLIFYKNRVLKSVYAKNNYGEWERLIVTYTNNTDADIENVYIYFYPTRGVGEVTYFTCPKIEEGSQATPWTPAPEDLGLNYPDSIQNFNSSISGNNIIVPEFIEGYPFVKPVIDDSLVLWLDGSTGNNYEQTGTWKDLSGNGNDGELRNFGYTEGSGWVDGGLKFDGVDDYVSTTLNEVVGLEYSLEVIFSIHDKSSLKHTGCIIDNDSNWLVGKDSGVALGIGLNYGEYIRHIDRVGWNLGPKIPLSDIEEGVFYHLVAVGLQNGGKLFLDGGKVDEKIYSKGNSTSANITIGRRTNHYHQPIVVNLVRIYNRALTDEEIMQNYRAGQCSPLLAMRGDV